MVLSGPTHNAIKRFAYLFRRVVDPPHRDALRCCIMASPHFFCGQHAVDDGIPQGGDRTDVETSEIGGNAALDLTGKACKSNDGHRRERKVVLPDAVDSTRYVRGNDGRLVVGPFVYVLVLCGIIGALKVDVVPETCNTPPR